MNRIKEKINELSNKLSDIFSISKEFIKSIKAIITKKKKDNTFIGLNPIDNADKEGVYCHALKCALEDSGITNIAVSGIYSAGKSSILKTFFSKLENKKYRPINVSISSVDTIKEDGITENELYHSVENSILQSILYSGELKKAPLSRYKRMVKHSFFKNLIIAIVLLIVIYFTMEIINPTLVEIAIENFFNARLPRGLMVCLLSITMLFIIWITYNIIFMLKNKITINKVKLSDAEIEVGNKAESIFNRNMDEILYYFQTHKHRVVVIEDLDRFEGKINVAGIFEKLKEVNGLINSSDQVKYQVNFIYAVRDDFFKNSEIRTKFFDMTIPVIPTASTFNANEIIWKRLQDLKENNIFENELTKSFINKISVYIENKRIIDCIINEFIIYKRKLKKDNLNDDKLFAIVTYKNKFPDRYAELQNGKGCIVDIFNKIAELKKDETEKLKDKKIQLKNKRNALEDECLNNVKELKKILVSSLYNYAYNYSTAHFEINGQTVSIDRFINEIRI